MLYPKPKLKKQKRAKNNPKPTANDVCMICLKPFASTHEVFYGTGQRQLSIRYAMQVKLCQEHHTGNKGVHNNKRMDLRLKQQFQQQFEYLYGHEKFMQVFGRNYLAITYEEYIKGVA